MKMSRSASALACIAALSAGTASAQDLRLLSAWDASYTVVPLMVDRFVELVSEASDGSISISVFGPEVAPPFEQLEPTAAGVFDLHFTHGGYHQGTTGIGSSLDGIDGDPAARRESGVWDWVDDYYQANHNIKIVSIPSALTGFQLLLREPMVDGRIDGQTVRGTQVYHGVIQTLGGAPVTLPPSEIYAAAERGVINGIAWPAVGAIGMRLCEVTPYMIRPSFGVVSYLIMMNLDSFNALSDEAQEIVMRAGEELELETVMNFEEILVEEDAEMIACGGEILDQGAEWGAQVQAAFSDSVWALGVAGSGAAAEELRELAREKGLTN